MFDRRQFLKICGLTGIGMVANADLSSSTTIGDPSRKAYPWRLSEDYYRQEFALTQGDSTGYAFHCSNCQGNCAWRVHARDGVIIREEQVAEYPQINPKILDTNPRGCNKGAIHSQAIYEKDRILYPMKRLGKRGEGKWQRMSWEQALWEIAQKMVNTIKQEGLGEIMLHAGTGILSQGRRAGPLRLGSLLGAIRLYPASAVGDMFSGATLAYGITNVGHSLDAWFDANYIILWGINPNVTRIPDAHYLWEAKYNGTKIVSIAPDHNPSSIHSNFWVPIKPGTDSFLAISIINVILRQKLYQGKESFIKEQTDLPLLVRVDNKRFLREKDVKETGSEEIFYLWDTKTQQCVEAPGTKGSQKDTLRLGEIVPALEGIFKVKNYRGVKIEVTTVFECIKREAARFPPEETSSLTGIHPNLVYKIAEELAGAKKAIINIGFSIHKYVWGILSCWGAALICALTGHSAVYGGLDTEHNWSLGGLGSLSNPKPPRFGSGFFGEWMLGHMWETFKLHYDDRELKEKTGFGQDQFLALARKTLTEKWLPYFGEPKIVLLFADNRYWRNKSEDNYRKATLDQVELYVNVNHRMDSSAELADYILPGLSHYEAWDIRGELGYHRFVNLNRPPANLKSIGEAKSEWEICRLLALKIEELAKRGGVSKIEDEQFKLPSEDGKEKNVSRDLDTLHSDFTMDGKLMTDRDVVEWIIENVPAMQPWSLENAERRGFLILNEKAGFTSPLYSTKAYHSFERQVFLKRTYPTLSGRQQFYIDHDLFVELGTVVPTARLPSHPSKYPFAYYSPHTRWGIHTQWRSNKYMLRLQRGIPHVYINPKVARERGIKDGDMVIWSIRY